MVRFVENREGGLRGPVEDLYLGVYGSAGVEERYGEEIREWIERSLQIGWAPAGWQPDRTGHEGVLTVEGLVGGFRRYLNEIWGENWEPFEPDPGKVQEFRAEQERARELMRRGRWERDKKTLREGKLLSLQVRRRFQALDQSLERLWTSRVLGDLFEDMGSMAAAVVGDRELRQLRKKWTELDVPLVDRKAGMAVVRDAFFHVIGREPWAPWDLERSYLERNAHLYGVDFGVVGPDGRWVRTG